MMLYSWWQSIKTGLAKDYYQFAQESLEMVRKVLLKTPPETSLSDYTDVTGEVTDGTNDDNDGGDVTPTEQQGTPEQQNTDQQGGQSDQVIHNDTNP